MMRVKFLVIVILVAVSFACSCAIDAECSPDNFVAVYLLHGNTISIDYYNIKLYIKEIIDKYFRNELDVGKLKFKMINVEKKGNEHFASEYQLSAESVVLSLIKDGKQVKTNNLTKVWDLLADRNAFNQYVKNEIERYLKEL